MSIRRTNTICISELYSLYERNKFTFYTEEEFDAETQEEIIDSILGDLPIGSIVISEHIDHEGRCMYTIIDGNKRFRAIFNMIEKSDDIPMGLWQYTPVFEYVNTKDDATIRKVRNRLNKR